MTARVSSVAVLVLPERADAIARPNRDRLGLRRRLCAVPPVTIRHRGSFELHAMSVCTQLHAAALKETARIPADLDTRRPSVHSGDPPMALSTPAKVAFESALMLLFCVLILLGVFTSFY